ncbi:MAG: mechanosensitive ion channel family protein [Muribaculaceae bacterium]|nr:mechanosensitive ion channel family protein [Muribaculaceae bacterium]
MTALIPSHDIAQWLLGIVRDICGWMGLRSDPQIEQIAYVILISTFAVGLGYVIRRAVIFAVRKIIRLRKTDFGTELLNQHVVTKCSHIIPPLVILALLPFAFEHTSAVLRIVNRLVYIYLTIMFGVGCNAIIGFAWYNYNRRANKENHPLKGVMNVAKGIVWIIITIISLSIIIDKSPMALLGGLGAFAAALMLIFKDSILGFVAGIQLSSNDMLRVGDWIVVPSTIANGIVIDVSLTVVKVQNWDNTIVMLPPYSLVSTSFQNWRGMSDSGVRQIDRSVIIDNTSIVAATDAFVSDMVGKYPLLKDFVAQRQADAKEGKPMVFNGGVAPVNGTLDTNIGLFRAYMCRYLLTHPAIAHDQNIIVRLMTPDANGTPLDIYCFTATTDWLAYEAIRSQLFEHIATSAADFGLRIFNATYNGRITVANGSAPAQAATA